jgi:hypothetical protein
LKIGLPLRHLQFFGDRRVSIESVRRYFGLAAAVILFMSCRGDAATVTEPPPPAPPPPPPPTGPPGLKVVAGSGVIDTVDAQPAQAIVVEVRDAAGKAISGAIVRFQSRPPSDPTRQSEGAIFVCALTVPVCSGSQFVADTTDVDARAKAIVRLGTVAGKAVVRVTVPELGLEDSATFTVNPGAPARMILSPRDTGLDIGGTFTIQGRAADRYRNARSEVPTFFVGTGGAVTLDAASNLVTARDMGTYAVYAHLGDLTDSASVRVLPTGRLLVWSPEAAAVRLVDINGKNEQTLITSVGSDFGVFPRFTRSRQGITLHSATQISWVGPSTDAIVLDTTGTPRRDISGFSRIIAIRQTDDGNVMVVGRRAGDPGWYAVFRVTADNTITLLRTLEGFSDIYGSVDINYDGNRVAYVDGNRLVVVDVSTGALTTLADAGRSPRWSVQGDRLAYLLPATCPGQLDGRAFVINADGSGGKALPDSCFSPGLGWSPDGKFVIGRMGLGGLRIVRVSDGMAVQFVFFFGGFQFNDYYQPDWR